MKFPVCKRFVWVAVGLLLLAACRNAPVQKAVSAQKDSVRVAASASVEKDSTRYGVAGDFGMSTFCLITDEGDTILVTRSSEDGTDGSIYGDAQPGDRFCMTLRDNGEVLGLAINLTQLERHTKNYRIWNGRLILHPDSKPDTVAIDVLNAHTFIYVSSNGDVSKHIATDELPVCKK